MKKTLLIIFLNFYCSLSSYCQSKSDLIDSGKGTAINTLDSILKSNVKFISFCYGNQGCGGNVLNATIIKKRKKVIINCYQCVIRVKYEPNNKPAFELKCDSLPYFNKTIKIQKLINDLNFTATKNIIYDPTSITFKTSNGLIDVKDESEASLIKRFIFELSISKDEL